MSHFSAELPHASPMFEHAPEPLQINLQGAVGAQSIVLLPQLSEPEQVTVMVAEPGPIGSSWVSLPYTNTFEQLSSPEHVIMQLVLSTHSRLYPELPHAPEPAQTIVQLGDVPQSYSP